MPAMDWGTRYITDINALHMLNREQYELCFDSKGVNLEITFLVEKSQKQ